MTDTQIIDATNDSDLRDGVIRMSTSSAENIIEKRSFEFERVLDSLFCESIPNTVDKILSKICRFNEYSAEYYIIRSAILVTFITDNKVDDFMIPDELYPYYLFVTSVLRDKLKLEMDKDFSNSNLFGSLNQVQVETMSGGLV